MFCKVCVAASAAVLLLPAAPASAQIKRTSYPQVKVELVPVYKPDAAFDNLRKQFGDAVAKKDAAALFALVAPGFVWTQNNNLTTDFDPGRDALHNFKVVFGFRAPGKDADGGVENGPFWNALAAFAGDGSYSQPVEGKSLVCSPATALIADEGVFEQARARVETPEEGADWHFVLRSTPVSKAPDDKGPPVGTLGVEAVPVLGSHPPDAPPTHFEVLLPSGRTGWIPAGAARSFQADRLCYVLTATGEWKIAIYDAAE
jgi:hypothetical protein